MTGFWDLIVQLFSAFQVLVTVQPWEQGLRVRLGRHVKKLEPGMCWRWPLIDQIHRQNTRLRMLNLPVQTLTTKDGRTLTLSAAAGYAIADIEKLYQKMHDTEDTIGNLVLSAVGRCVKERNADECTPEVIEKEAAKLVRFRTFGLTDASIYLTDFAFVRTYRLITDNKWGDLRQNVVTE